jgi:hypothetical protein
VRVPLTLIAAGLADGHACLQQRSGGGGVVFRRAADNPAGGGADIGAVQAQPDALTISARFCSLKSASVSAVRAWAQSLIASMAAASTLRSTLTVRG